MLKLMYIVMDVFLFLLLQRRPFRQNGFVKNVVGKRPKRSRDGSTDENSGQPEQQQRSHDHQETKFSSLESRRHGNNLIGLRRKCEKKFFFFLRLLRLVIRCVTFGYVLNFNSTSN